MNFKEKSVIVTGAAAGIGKASVIQFLKQGAKVAAIDHNAETLDALKAELCEYKENLLCLNCDISNEQSVNKTAEAVFSQFGKVDILVNNAAIWRYFSPFSETTTEVWKNFLNINILGTVYFTKAVIDSMLKNGFGRIINVASVSGVYGNAEMTAYSATKGAVIAFTKALAKEVADKGITVNAVSPGSVSPAEKNDINYFEESTLSFTGRTGTTKENADLICFLASENAAYINGQNIQIDGCRKKM